MEQTIPYARQEITQADISAVERVLRGNWIAGNGPACHEFEQALQDITAYKHAVVVNSATSALYICHRAMPYNGVVIPELSFQATPNAALLAGKRVYVYPVHEDTWCLPGKKDIGIGNLCRHPVSYAGYPIHKEHQSPYTIIDNAHYLAPGMGLQTRATSVVSFHPVKHITCGEGGAILTHSDELAEAARSLRNHGQPGTGPGLNFRMPDINAALGLSQIRRLDSMLARRRSIAHYYRDHEFASLVRDRIIKLQKFDEDHTYHIFVLSLTVDNPRAVRNEFRKRMLTWSIETQVHYPPYLKSERLSYYEPSEEFLGTLVTIPLFPSMTDEQVEHVATATKTVLQELTDAL